MAAQQSRRVPIQISSLVLQNELAGTASMDIAFVSVARQLYILCPIESVDSSVPVCMKILKNSR